MWNKNELKYTESCKQTHFKITETNFELIDANNSICVSQSHLGWAIAEKKNISQIIRQTW